MICRNKGLTEESIKALCHSDIPLYLKFLDGKDLKDTTNIDVEDFLYMCQTERKNEACTIGRKFTSLNSFYKTLIRKDLGNIKTNPLDRIDPIKVRKKVKDYLTEEEVKRVFNYLEEIDDKRGLALLYLAYSSACRISELVQLNRNTLDFEKRRFKVKGKGDKERICMLSEQAKEKILDYLNSRTDDLEPLFISRESNRWNKRSIQRYVKSLMEKLGINKHITIHSFRHSILTHMRLHGESIENLQLLAGHSSIQTTQNTYTHVGLEDISDKFDNFFNKQIL
jgi:integrase/recombinase XerD